MGNFGRLLNSNDEIGRRMGNELDPADFGITPEDIDRHIIIKEIDKDKRIALAEGNPEHVRALEWLEERALFGVEVERIERRGNEGASQ